MISTIDEYNAELLKIKNANNTMDSRVILYRGQKDHEWGIKTSLERHGKKTIKCSEYYRIIDRYKPLLNPILDRKFERKATLNGYPYSFEKYDEDSRSLPEMEYLAYLRHHGFPTPIIDWSSSPYIALFFACEDFNESNKNGKVFIYAEPNIISRDNNTPEFRHAGRYVEAGKRHFSQQSEYLIPMKYRDEWEFISYDEVKSSNSQHSVCEIEIECSAKYIIMTDLKKMNINRYTMYLDEDSLVKAFADEWALEKINNSNV
ncbi:MAG: FRG domain-containing protein [Desulfobacteraceae bacterium]|nr:FRG domain-containing protein [Desulfobacteraceae bacterium]